MNWKQAKHYWPFAQYSQFTLQKPHLWHIQDIGTGPVILLIHGAGSTTHSWQHLVPFLTDRYRVIMVDLPGQGFTRLGAQQRCGLVAWRGGISRQLFEVIDADTGEFIRMLDTGVPLLASSHWRQTSAEAIDPTCFKSLCCFRCCAVPPFTVQ